jgi:hypothetical protein
MHQPCTIASVRRHYGAVETTITGRVDAAAIRTMAADYRRLGCSETWYIDASATRSYAPAAIAEAVKLFGALTIEGLRKIVSLISNPLVRMGAHTVGMSLAASGSKLSIVVVDSADEFRR